MLDLRRSGLLCAGHVRSRPERHKAPSKGSTMRASTGSAPASSGLQLTLRLMSLGDSKVIQFSERLRPERHKALSKGGVMRVSVSFSARFAGPPSRAAINDPWHFRFAFNPDTIRP